MGADYSVFLGPYLECKNSLVESFKPRKYCRNHQNTSFYDNDVFCKYCGSQLEEMKISYTNKAISKHNLRMQIGEALCDHETDNKTVDVWVPNLARKKKNVRDFHSELSISSVEPITAEMMQEEMAEFMDQYAEAYHKLHEAYDGKVMLKWGLIISAW